jgi:N-acetyl-anhydromuramyl-L-alanine amidase AmpD
VLHYTAASLERTLEIFLDPRREVSAHLVIDLDGAVYETVPCLNSDAKRAWHAGRSRLVVGVGAEQRLVEGFNDCSLGIELVNLNGNVYPYTEAQYAALFAVVEQLKGFYPALANPNSVIGHEQIAGFRGKADPGRCFEWNRFFGVCYPQQGAPSREHRCSVQVAERLAAFCSSCGINIDKESGLVQVPPGLPEAFFEGLSSLVEAMLGSSEL